MKLLKLLRLFFIELIRLILLYARNFYIALLSSLLNIALLRVYSILIVEPDLKKTSIVSIVSMSYLRIAAFACFLQIRRPVGPAIISMKSQ